MGKRIYLAGHDNVGWSIDSDNAHTRMLLSELNLKLVNQWPRANIIHTVWYNQLKNWRIHFWKHKYIIAHITNDTETNGKAVLELAKHVHLWIAANAKQVAFLEAHKLNYAFQPFFVDSEVFKPIGLHKSEICSELGIDYNVFRDKKVIVSIQRDSTGSDLTQPKWQKDPTTLIEILKAYKKADSNFILLLAGPRRHYVINKCKEFGIPYFYYGKEYGYDEDDLLLNNLKLPIVNQLYNLGDVYIVSSKSEGGPKAILEACWTRLPIISTDVGFAKEILTENLIYNHVNEAVGLLLKLNNSEFSETCIKQNYNTVSIEYSRNAHLERWRKIYDSI